MRGYDPTDLTLYVMFWPPQLLSVQVVTLMRRLCFLIVKKQYEEPMPAFCLDRGMRALKAFYGPIC
ncbi:hypothetical protein PM01_00975 [Sulfitobacter pontiacus 3SOLIMAR09]|nr:hypothetical protein PM01_00975 [Sulfitobacter pontiacus 3SOLIMAR09]